MLTVKELKISDELWKSVSIKETAGANIEEARGEMKVMLESKAIRNHFLDSGKLRGISGSNCDSHPTMPLSRSEVGSLAGSRRAFLLLDVRVVAIRDNLLLALDRVFIRPISCSSTAF
jgi:hypothetical protein